MKLDRKIYRLYSWFSKISAKLQVIIIQRYRNAGLTCLIALLLFSCTAKHEFADEKKTIQAEDVMDKMHFAKYEGELLTIEPQIATLTLPKQWISWNQKYNNNLHLSMDELAKVAQATQEWDEHYANISNAVLPFKNCIAHLGGDGWDTESVSYSELQMRIYTKSLSADELSIHLSEVLAEAYERTTLVLSTDNIGQWQKETVKIPVNYADYGGVATVSFLTPLNNSNGITLVFFHSDSNGKQLEQQTEILSSFTLLQKQGDS